MPEPESHVGPQALDLRPLAANRLFGWGIAVFGVLFGLSGLAAPDDPETLITMALGGVVFTLVGLANATARVLVNSTGIRYRSAFMRRQVSSSDVLAVEVGPGSHNGPPRLALTVRRRNGRAIKLIGIQRWDTERARGELAATAQDMMRALGIEPLVKP